MLFLKLGVSAQWGRRAPAERRRVCVEGGGACFIPKPRAIPVAKPGRTVPPVSTRWRLSVLDQNLSLSLQPSRDAAGGTPHLSRWRLSPSPLDVYPTKAWLLHLGLPVWGDQGPPAGVLSAACPLVEEENRNVQMQDTRDQVVSWPGSSAGQSIHRPDTPRSGV